jgi:hypothetical protein
VGLGQGVRKAATRGEALRCPADHWPLEPGPAPVRIDCIRIARTTVASVVACACASSRSWSACSRSKLIETPERAVFKGPVGSTFNVRPGVCPRVRVKNSTINARSDADTLCPDVCSACRINSLSASLSGTCIWLQPRPRTIGTCTAVSRGASVL